MSWLILCFGITDYFYSIQTLVLIVKHFLNSLKLTLSRYLNGSQPFVVSYQPVSTGQQQHFHNASVAICRCQVERCQPF